MGTLTAVFSPVGNNNHIFHITLVYKDGNTTEYAQMVPATPNSQLGLNGVDLAYKMVEAVEKAAFNAPSAWGTLKSDIGTFNPSNQYNGIERYPALDPYTNQPHPNAGQPFASETLSTNVSSAQWSGVKNTLQSINDLNLTYSPFTQNSNSSSCTALRKAGLPTPSFPLLTKQAPGCSLTTPTTPAELKHKLDTFNLSGTQSGLMMNSFVDAGGYKHTDLNFVDSMEGDRNTVYEPAGASTWKVTWQQVDAYQRPIGDLYSNSGLTVNRTEIFLHKAGISADIQGDSNSVRWGNNADLEIDGNYNEVISNDSEISFYDGRNGNGVYGDGNWGENWDFWGPDWEESSSRTSGTGVLQPSSDPSKLIEGMASMGESSGAGLIEIRPLDRGANLSVAATSQRSSMDAVSIGLPRRSTAA